MSIFLGALKKKSKLSPKQFKALLKVQKLVNEASDIWQKEQLNIMLDNGNKVFSGTNYHLYNTIYGLPFEISSYNNYLENY